MSDLRVVLPEMRYEEDGWDVAFVMLEAAYLIFCDWGEYHLSNYFHEIQFRPVPDLSYETLSEEGQALYDMLEQEMGYQAYGTMTAYDYWLGRPVPIDKVVLHGREQKRVKTISGSYWDDELRLIYEDGETVLVDPDAQLLICRK